MKVIHIDIETTGLKPATDQITEIALVEEGKVIFNVGVGLQGDEYVDEEAILNFFDKYINSLCKSSEEPVILAGWRANEFDIKFIKHRYKLNKIENKGLAMLYPSVIDVKSLYLTEKIVQCEDLKTYTHLRDAATDVNIDVNVRKLHTAAYDALLSYYVYKAVTQHE